MNNVLESLKKELYEFLKKDELESILNLLEEKVVKSSPLHLDVLATLGQITSDKKEENSRKPEEVRRFREQTRAKIKVVIEDLDISDIIPNEKRGSSGTLTYANDLIAALRDEINSLKKVVANYESIVTRIDGDAQQLTRIVNHFDVLNDCKKFGLERIHKNRSSCNSVIQDAFALENTNLGKIRIVGSSLKGFIGIGLEAQNSEHFENRIALETALAKGVNIRVLMTHPVFAKYRAKQEGRGPGEIELEIIENLIYLLSLKDKSSSSDLEIRLFQGTPTIFMIATKKIMIINPYPYYQTAYSSFLYELKGGSDMHTYYYEAQYRETWLKGEPRKDSVNYDKVIEIINMEHLDLAPDKKAELLEKINDVRNHKDN